MHGQLITFTKKHRLWLYLAGLTILSGLLLLSMHAIKVLTHSPLAIPTATLSSEIIFDLIILPLTLMISRHIPSPWRYFFVFIALEAILRIIISLQIIIFFQSQGSTANPMQMPVSEAIHTVFYIIRPIYWATFAILALHQSRAKLKTLIPSLPTAITIFLALGYMLWLYSHYHVSYHLSLWAFTNASYDVLLCVFLIYCLPIARNKIITLLIVSYLLLTIGDIVGTKFNFFIPYFKSIQAPHFFWILGNLFLIYSLVNFLKNKNQHVSEWFYAIDSTRAQVGYWGNSIVSLLFLILSIRYLTLPLKFREAHLIFHVNTVTYIGFLTLLSLLTLFFSRLFTRDFYKISQMTNLFANNKSVSTISIKPLYFKELRKLAQFLKKKLVLIEQKSQQEKELFLMARRTASNIEKPLSILYDLSRKIEEQLNIKQQWIQKNALMRLQVIADDVLTVESATQTQNKEVEKPQPIGSYPAITFHELAQEKNVQFYDKDIDLKTRIETNAWFIVSAFPENKFYRITSNLINNAIEACEHRQTKQVNCHLRHQVGEPHFHLTISDSGCGMNDQQIKAILAGEGKTTKAEGHGIGLRYVIDTVNRWNGRCEISSTENVGTEFHLTLPLLKPTPPWWTNKITLPPRGIIIIYDSDRFYHQLWKNILHTPLKQLTGITLIHCYTLNDFKQSLRTTEKQLVLMDIDSAQNPTDSMHIIIEQQLQSQTILVTQHYHNLAVQTLCDKDHIKLLPKPLIPYTEIDYNKES